MARKRKRVPEVLWRLFRDRARTLADTILALIPPSPATEAECRCKGRRCLSCCGDEAMSFLVRPGDPPDYRKLLTGCFVVVSENAPPLSVFDPTCRWSQCEDNRSSAVVDILTSSKWTVLLRRVGDALMMNLLMYTSLFLPLPRKKHHQIAGFPINDLCFKFSRHMPDSKSQHHPHAYNGSRKKRKRVEGVESIPGKQLCTYSLGSKPSSNSIRFVASNGSSCVSNEEFSHNKCEGSLKQITVSSQKRTRQYRWQRQRKRRELVVRGTHSLIPCRENSCNSDNLSRGLLNGVCTSSSQSDECK